MSAPVYVSRCCGADYEYWVEGDDAVTVCLECGDECTLRYVPEPEDVAVRKAERRGEK